MQLRELIASQKLICVKLSGQAFGTTTTIFHHQYIDELAKAFVEILQQKATKLIKFVVIVGAGNIWRGVNGKGIINSDQSDYMGMIATNLNAIYLRERLTANKVRTVVLSALQIGTTINKFSVDQAQKLLRTHQVLIISSGTGYPGVTTDSATEKYARKLGIKLVIIGKNGVNFVYDADPKIDPHARQLNTTTFRYLVEHKIHIIDIKAAKKYINSAVCAIVININNPQNLVKLFMNLQGANYSIVMDR